MTPQGSSDVTTNYSAESSSLIYHGHVLAVICFFSCVDSLMSKGNLRADQMLLIAA